MAWLAMGRPNPNGLGYLSKGLEIGLIVALGAHLWHLLRPRIAGQARLAARVS